MRRFSASILAGLAMIAGFLTGAPFFGGAGKNPALSQPPRGHGGGTELTSLRANYQTDPATWKNEMRAAMMSALIEEEPFLRGHLLHDLFAKLSPSEWPALLELALQIENDDVRSKMLGPLLQTWFRRDADAAGQAMLPYRERFRSSRKYLWHGADAEVYQVWARIQPATALDEAMANRDTEWAFWIARSAIMALSDDDPARQLGRVTQLPASKLRDNLLEAAILTTARKDSAMAEAQLQLVSDPKKRLELREELLKDLAKKDPAACIARLSALAPELQPSLATTKLLMSTLTAAAATDPVSAIALVDRFPENLRAQAMSAALVGWAGRSPVDALNWAMANGVDPSDMKSVQFYGDADNPTWNSLGDIAFKSDRAKTLEWLRRQPPSSQRDRLIAGGIWNGNVEDKIEAFGELTPQGRLDSARMMTFWLVRDDPVRAESWVKELPAGPEREAAVTGFLLSLAQTAPERSEALAEIWLQGSDRNTALSVFATTQQDPRKAIEFARQVDDADTREVTFEKVARSWISRDKSAALAWIFATDDLAPWQKRVLLRQADEK